MGIRKVNTLTPDIIFDIQNKNSIEAIRYEIAWKYWEYKQLVPFHTSKLFLLNRCQRNFFVSIILILFMILLFPLGNQQLHIIPTTCKIVFSLLLGILFLLGDTIFDRLGFWDYS